jgi:hypothetical protein
MGGGQVTEPKKFKEYECTFRDRLREAKEDHWWNYGTTDAEAEASVASLVDLYKRRGALFLVGLSRSRMCSREYRRRNSTRAI